MRAAPLLAVVCVGAAVMFAAQPVQAEPLGAVVARCAPRVAPRTALAIIATESSGVWWAVNDNDRPTPPFATPAAAIAYAEHRIAEGGNIDIGLAQLNSSHLAEYRVSVREAFEPCTNVALGMDVLAQAWATARARWGMTALALFRAFEAYNGGEGVWSTRDTALRARVDRHAQTVWATALALSPRLNLLAAAAALPRDDRAARAVLVQRRLPAARS